MIETHWCRARGLAQVGVALIAAQGFACGGVVPVELADKPAARLIGCTSPNCPIAGDVAVTYLGVGGFLIEWQGHSILTGPSFTNPGVDSVAPSAFYFFRGSAPPIRANPELIDRFLPAGADNASMILVGHGHYDHLLDVPYVALHRARRAQILGSPSVRHMLMGDAGLRSDSNRLVAIDTAQAGTVDRIGHWFYSDDSLFRVMALVADHAPTIRLFGRGRMFADGVVTTNLSELPARAEDWKLGEPYSFVIDLLSPTDRSTVFRIYFQDAPNTVPLGFPPRMLGGRQFDVALLCVATARNVRPTSPDGLLQAVRPRYAIGAHWESFFRTQERPVAVNPASDIPAFVESLKRGLPVGSGWSIPLPQTTFHFVGTSR